MLTKTRLLGAWLILAAGASGAPKHDHAALDAVLRMAVERKAVPGVVAMVANAGGVIYEGSFGFQPDAIFAIASMTKPITSVAVMQLVEAGKVRLDEPAATYLPELAKAQVLENGSLRAPQHPVTVRQLLTHTSGFGYEFMNRDLHDYILKAKLPSMSAGGDGFLNVPLLFDPGTQWEYGIGIDWLGRLVERVSGETLEDYFHRRIFEPLGMPDTAFNVPTGKQARRATQYQRMADGSLAAQPRRPAGPVTFYSGGGGLFSTAADYLKFTRAILAGGSLGRSRILRPESVAMMGRNQIGELHLHPLPSLVPQLAKDRAQVPGALDKFGLGFALNTRPIANGRGANTMSWAGIFNTFFWIDREKRLTVVLMTQMLPGLEDGPIKLLEKFDRAVYGWRK